MTPLNCRLDLQSCAFEAHRKEQKLLSASDVAVSTEPWCAFSPHSPFSHTWCSGVTRQTASWSKCLSRSPLQKH